MLCKKILIKYIRKPILRNEIGYFFADKIFYIQIIELG